MAASGAAEENRPLVADQPAQRPVKTGGQLVNRSQYYWLLLAEGHLNRRLFGEMLGRIWARPLPGG
jgi:hypothetical protein